jgi:ectoine hydroxylase-related dioxygenase (phytanoyl-CoA dioxygenase family)
VTDGNGRIQDAHAKSDAIRQISLHPPVLEMLEAVYARKPLPFQTLNFRWGTQQPAHSDTLHFNSSPSGFMCGVWVALEDITESNGPLIYYPGSHLLPELQVHDFKGPDESGLRAWYRWRYEAPLTHPDPEAIKRIFHAYEQHIPRLIEKRKLKPKLGIMKRGRAVLWAANLLHGGSPITDRDSTRYSMVTHYFFEGCKYYTPLLSTRRYTHWREPEWIREPPDQPAP